jgi:autotransporter-associated beta strand protein
MTLGNAIHLNAGGALTTPVSGSLGLTGTIDGLGSLAKSGAGTLSLNGNNSYSGGTVLSAGTLSLGHANALGTGTLSTAGGTTLDTSVAGLNVGNALSVTGTLNLAGSNA